MTPAHSAPPLNWNSRQLTHGWQRGVKAFFWGLGFSEADFDKAQVGIGVPLLDGNICNVHAHDLALKIKAGCAEAGLIGLPFGVPGVSDNITQGHEGGNASLPSRNLIANSAEMVVSAHCYDALVGLHHCDKNGPGFAMALARLNCPGLLVSGGSILPGCHEGRNITILDAYDAQAKADQGALSRAESEAIIRVACPGPGGCGIAASFNTWGIAMEAIGLMLPDSSSIPAVDAQKSGECARVGAAVRVVLEQNIRPREVLTKAAFVNSMTAFAAAGGSTNGVLHLLALAHEAEVDFTLHDVQAICRRTPVLANFAPRGHGTMNDLHHLGGTTFLLRHFLDAGLLDGSCPTVTGRTLAENCPVQDRREVSGCLRPSPLRSGSSLTAPSRTLTEDCAVKGTGVPALAGTDAPPRDAPVSRDDRAEALRLKPRLQAGELLAPANAPFKPFADIQICFGNVAPDGIVFKASSLVEPRFTGAALCFSDARAVSDAAAAGTIRPGHVVVLRGLGPVGSGMPEVLIATAALSTPALNGTVALVSDTRVSGVSHGCIGVHCAPEAAVGGPIGQVRDGDVISFDLLEGSIHVEADLAARPTPPRPTRHTRTYLADFASTVAQANLGCVSRR